MVFQKFSDGRLNKGTLTNALLKVWVKYSLATDPYVAAVVYRNVKVLFLRSGKVRSNSLGSVLKQAEAAGLGIERQQLLFGCIKVKKYLSPI
jgi:hypothetical protein